MNDKFYPVEADGFSLVFDESGNLPWLQFSGKDIQLSYGYTIYEIDGIETIATYLASEQGLAYRLETKKLAKKSITGKVVVISGPQVSFHFEVDQPGAAKRVGLSFFLPESANIHLAEYRSIGHLVDKDMPNGETYTCKLCYNFLLVDLNETWLRLQADTNSFNAAEVTIVRRPQSFNIIFTWPIDTDASIALFPTQEAAIQDFQRIIDRDYGAQKMCDPKRNEESWVHKTKAIITADMVRPNWEITHDYEDIQNLAYDLKEAGCPADTLFYLPGWQGPYDALYPTYWPYPDLGGEEGFRRMVDAMHESGYRVMIHVNGWGIDPYHPDIDQLEKYILRYKDGGFIGWQTDGRWLPPSRSIKVTPARIPLSASNSSKFFFQTIPIPGFSEILLTLGGIKARDGRIRLTAHKRSITSPVDWFSDHESFDYPFPLLLMPGINDIEVEVIGVDEVDWSSAWYCCRDGFTSDDLYSSWSWPILWADTQHPEFIELFINNVCKMVRRFGVDAVHVDATWPNQPDMSPPCAEIIQRLQEELPDIVLSSEAVMSFSEMGIWAFSQNATLGLIDSRRRPREQGSLPLAIGSEELYAWLDKPSPVCAFAQDYFYNYPHLVAANSFVKVGKISNIYSPRKFPLTSDEQWKVWHDAQRLNYIPGLRANYREFGLDEETRAAIAELLVS
jgi:hypothetical protein